MAAPRYVASWRPRCHARCIPAASPGHQSDMFDSIDRGAILDHEATVAQISAQNAVRKGVWAADGRTSKTAARQTHVLNKQDLGLSHL